MRKPENKEKFAAAIDAMVTFYGKKDKKMVADVLSQKAEAARAQEAEWWEKRLKSKEERRSTELKPERSEHHEHDHEPEDQADATQRSG